MGDASAIPFLERRFHEVSRTALEAEPECSTGAANRQLVSVAEQLDRCDREAAADSDCEVQVLVGLGSAGGIHPPLSTYVALRRKRLCAWHLTQGQTAAVASGKRSHRRSRSVDLPIETYASSALHCSVEERGQLRDRLMTAFETGLDRKGPTYERFRHCRTVQTVDETDEPVRQMCTSLEKALAEKVAAASKRAASAALPGLALGLVARANELGIPSGTPAGTVKEWKAALRKQASWRIDFQFVNRAGKNGEIASQALQGLRSGASTLPEAFDWRPADARSDARTIGVKVTLGASFQIRRRKSQRKGTSNWESGHRTVENPRYYQLQQACVGARNELKRCYARSAQEKRAADQCAAAKQRSRAELQACNRQKLAEIRQAGYSARLCLETPIFCSTQYSTCNPNYADPVCERYAGEPQKKQVPVYSQHGYRIHKVHQSAAMPMRVVAKLGRTVLHDARFQVTFEQEDEHVAPEPAYNVHGDPLQLADEADVIADLADKSTHQLSKALRDINGRLCDGLLAKEEKAVRRSDTPRSLHAVAVARRAGCTESKEQKERAQALLERYLSEL